jgi:tetratricopeptide (TPR) repeat protein
MSPDPTFREDRPDPIRVATKRDFARELTLAKDRASVTVREIARQVGIPASTVGGYFSGKHLPALRPADLLANILEACGIVDDQVVERWRQALRRARRATGDQASPSSEPDIREIAVLPGQGVPGSRTGAGGPVERSVLVSTRPPVDRLLRGPEIRGRDALLARLSQHALVVPRPSPGPHVSVLYGLGGSGKSTVALALARAAMDRDIRTWWISGTDPDSIVAGMQALAAELGASQDQIRLGSLIDLVWRLLEDYREPWLLIIDNADDPPGTLALPGAAVTDGNGWIRQIHSGYGLVLVTSRDGGATAWGDPTPPWVELVAVSPLGANEGAEVLNELVAEVAGSDRTASPAGPAHDARVLAQRLGGLPLALCLAGRHIAEARSIPPAFAGAEAARTFAGYVQALDHGRHDELFGAHGGTTTADRPARDLVGRTWELSLDLLAARGLPLARPLLRLLSCLGPGPVPCGLLLRPATLSASPLFGSVSGRLTWEMLRSLSGLAIVELTRRDAADPDLVDMATPHPLVRDMSRHSPDVRADIGSYLALVTALINAAEAQLDPKDPRTWARWRALVDHSNSPLDLLQEFKVGARSIPPGVWSAATLSARYQRAAGELVRAEAAYARVARFAVAACGADDPHVLEIQHDLSRVWYDLGRLGAATRGLRAVLKMRVRILGPDHPDTLTTQHYLARTLRDAGQLDAAWRLFRRTLDTRRAVLGEDHPDTLTSRNNAADALRTLGRLDQAANELQAVLDARIRLLGPEHPATLVSRYNLARLARDRDDLAAAAADLVSLVETYRRVLGADHPRTLVARQALVDVWHDLGEWRRAEAEAREVLARRRASIGSSHPATLVTQHRLGLLLVDLGDLTGAEAEIEAVLAARRLVLGARHPDTTLARESLDALRSRR